MTKAAGGFGGNRSAASEAWNAEGDKFLRSLNYDFAMRRYNQAWLLNTENYKPYWGFARVMVQKYRYREAFRHFETAVRLCDDDYQKTALLSDMAVAYSFDGQYDRANDGFEQSTNLDSNYAYSWLRWSQSLYREGRYVESWEKLKVAKELGVTPSEEFLRELSNALPEPQ